MSKQRHLRVVAVSPSDVEAERSAIARVVEETDRILGPSLNVSLELWRWESDAHPGFHPEGPQGIIDELMDITHSDLVVGVFWTRFGTPTRSASSGTEHELARAWDSWRRTGRPQVMVYFSHAPSSPGSQADLEQWGRVLEFKKRFPKEGFWWAYDTPADLERLFRIHLQKYLLANYKETTLAPPTVSGCFDSPIVSDAIRRPRLWAGLETALRGHAVVVLGGLSGSGKTYLMSAYVAESLNSHSYSRVLWYDPSEGESLDNLLAFLGANVSLGGLSARSRCKALLAFLREQDALLVVDNYQLVDQSTYSLLVEILSRAGSPCRLVLLSQTYVALPSASRDPYQLLVSGFTLEETRRFLQARGLSGLPTPITSDLVDKTGGLPFAVNLFALLVGEFGHDPVELLSGIMEQETRIRSWFDRVLSLVDAEPRRLLPYLSLDESPFNIGVVRLLSKQIGLANAEPAFEQLQRRYLVGNHSPYRWKVHDLVARLSRSLLDAHERAIAHKVLGLHFLRGLPRRRDLILTEEQFVWKVRAFRHLWRSGADASLSRALLDEVAGTAKARGHYSLFLELSADMLSDPDRNRWVDYNHAHCALIVGHPAYCRRVVEPLLHDTEVISNETQTLAFTRLLSEALGSMHQERPAIEALTSALNAADSQKVGAVALAQAKSVLVWLFTRVGEYGEALKLCDELLAQAQWRNDERGGAVAWARMGVAKLRSGAPCEALDVLTRAVDLFRSARDRRGEAWSLTNCAEAHLSTLDEMRATECFLKASNIASDIGECGIEYRESIRRMSATATLRELTLLLEEEAKRVDLAAGFAPEWLTRGCA